MNLTTVAIGLLPCAYAFFVLTLRLKGKDDKFRKLGPMKERFGEKTGSMIHYIGYVAVPFICGIIVICAGFAGFSIIDIVAS